MSSDLTSPQYAVLATLAAFPGADQQTAGHLASLDKSSVADVVARLVRKAWVERIRDPSDGRRYILRLTPAAAIALNSLTPDAAEVQRALLKPLNRSVRVQFVNDLSAVARLDPVRLASKHPRGYPVLNLAAPGHLIRCAQQVHTSIWTDVVGPELTGPQYAVLHVVSRQPGINQKRLGELAALDKSSTADVVARLTSRGQLLRQRDPGDGRGRVLQVPKEELLRLNSVHPLALEVQKRLLEPVAVARRDEFVHELALVAFAGPPPPEAWG